MGLLLQERHILWKDQLKSKIIKRMNKNLLNSRDFHFSFNNNSIKKVFQLLILLLQEDLEIIKLKIVLILITKNRV